MNRSKRAIALDLRRPAAREAFGRLAATSDVLITNIREPALSGLGLAYEQVREHRADLIWTGVTAFGPEGPYRGRPGIDFLAQGYAGPLALNGEPDGPPVRVTVPLVDVLTAPINEIPEVVRDPQIRHNEMIVTTDHPKLGPLDVTGVPIHFHGTPGSVQRAPPLQGQHTEEILVELGYRPQEIADLLGEAAAATHAEIERRKAKREE